MLGRIDGDAIADGWYVLFDSGQETTRPVDYRDSSRVAVLPCVQGRSHLRPVFSWSTRTLVVTGLHPDSLLPNHFPASATHLSGRSISLLYRRTPISHCTSCVGPTGQERSNPGKHDRYPQPYTQYFSSRHNLTQFQALNPANRATTFNALVEKTKHHPGVAALGAGVLIAYHADQLRNRDP